MKGEEIKYQKISLLKNIKLKENKLLLKILSKYYNNLKWESRTLKALIKETSIKEV
jgi:hypothetical protein